MARRLAALLVLGLAAGARAQEGEPLPPGAALRLGTTRAMTLEAPAVHAFSPDGRLLAVGCDDDWLYVFEADTGRRLWRRQAHERDGLFGGLRHAVAALAFTPDGATLVTRSGHSPLLFVWDAATGALRRRIDDAPFAPDPPALRVTPDGALVVQGDLAWDLATGQRAAAASPPVAAGPALEVELVVPETPEEEEEEGDEAEERTEEKLLPPAALRVTHTDPEGRRSEVLLEGAVAPWADDWQAVLVDEGRAALVLARVPETADLDEGQARWRLFRVEGGREASRPEVPGVVSHTPALVSTGDALLVLQPGRPPLRVDWRSGATREQALAPPPPGSTDEGASKDRTVVALVRAGERLVGVDRARRLLAWSEDGAVTVLHPGPGPGPRLADSPGNGLQLESAPAPFLSPTGRTLWLVGETLDAWSLQPPGPLRPDGLHRGAVLAVAFSPDGETLATGCEDGHVRLWRRATGELLAGWLAHRGEERGDDVWEGAVTSLAWHPHGETLATGGWDRRVRVWEAATGRLVHDLEAESHGGTAVAFSPSGMLLVAADDRHVLVWDAATGTRERPLYGATEPAAVTFSPDGLRLATANHRGHPFTLFDMSTGAVVERRGVPEDPAGGVAFAADGRTLIGLLPAGPVRVVAGELVTPLPEAPAPHPLGPRGLRLLPGGERLAMGGGWPAILDATTGRELHRLTGHDGLVTSLDVSADGRWLATAGDDGTVLMWDLQGEALPGAPARAAHERRAPARPAPAGASRRLAAQGLSFHLERVAASADGERLLLVERPISGGEEEPQVGLFLAGGAGGWAEPRLLARIGGRPTAVALDAAGARAAFATVEALECRDAADGERRWTRPLEAGDQGQPLRLAFAPDAALVVADCAGRVERRDGAEGAVVARRQLELEDDFADVWVAPGLAWTADGQTLLVGSPGGVALLDARTLEPRGRLALERREDGWLEQVAALAVSADGRRVLAGGALPEYDPNDLDGDPVPLEHLHAWDLASAEHLAAVPLGLGEVHGLAFDPGGGVEAVCRGGRARVDAATWQVTAVTREELVPGSGPVAGGAALLLAGPGGQTLRRELRGGQERLLTASASTDAQALAVDPTGRLLATLDAGGLRLWDLATGELRRTRPLSGWPRAVTFVGPDRLLVVVNDEAATVYHLELRDAEGALLHELAGWSGPWSVASTAVATPDGARAFVGLETDSDGWCGVQALETASGRAPALGSAAAQRLGARALALSPDGELVAAAVHELVIVRAAAGLEHRVYLQGEGAVTALTFLPGRQLATVDGAPGGAVTVWELDGPPRAARALLGPAGAPPAEALAASSDGRRLAVARGDAIEVWDPTTGELLTRLEAGCAVSRLAFVPGGHTLVSGGAALLVWDLGFLR